MRSRLNKSENRKTANRGFSLIEVMVALAIFSVIIGGITLFSVRTIEANSRSRAMQNALENSRFAIETLSKKIRTTYYMRGSADPNDPDDYPQPNSQEVFFIDNYDMSKNCYEFLVAGSDTYLQVKKAVRPPESNVPGSAYQAWRRIVDCDLMDGYVGTIQDPLVGEGRIEASGGFNIKLTDLENDTYTDRGRGFIQMRIDLTYNGMMGGPADESTVTLQSGVSLRDYHVVGLELWDGEDDGYSLLYE